MYIVTGGAGFIGSALIWKLNKTGQTDILVVDNLGKSDKWKNLRNLKFADYIEKDRFIKEIEIGKFRKSDIDCLIHFGACSSTTETDCGYLIQNNYEYTKTLAEFSVSKNIRFIYASSAATYGSGDNGYSDDDSIMSKLKPLNMYGYSKHLFDLYAAQRGLLTKIAGLKFFNVFGPNEYHKADMRSIVHKAYYQIKSTGTVNLFKSYKRDFKDGEQKRDFIYIKEAISKVMCFIENPDVCGIFNIGTGSANTWNSFVTPIFEALRLPVKINYIEMPEYLRDKYQYLTEADMTKFNNSFNCEKIEIYKIADAVNDYVTNYLERGEYL